MGKFTDLKFYLFFCLFIYLRLFIYKFSRKSIGIGSIYNLENKRNRESRSRWQCRLFDLVSAQGSTPGVQSRTFSFSYNQMSTLFSGICHKSSPSKHLSRFLSFSGNFSYFRISKLSLIIFLLVMILSA